MIDDIIPEPLGGAAPRPREMGNTLKSYLVRYLRDLQYTSVEDLLEQRYQKFRRMGVFDEGLVAGEAVAAPLRVKTVEFLGFSQVCN